MAQFLCKRGDVRVVFAGMRFMRIEKNRPNLLCGVLCRDYIMDGAAIPQYGQVKLPNSTTVYWFCAKWRSIAFRNHPDATKENQVHVPTAAAFVKAHPRSKFLGNKGIVVVARQQVIGRHGVPRNEFGQWYVIFGRRATPTPGITNVPD